jgi:hypothetical protein
MWLEKIRNKPAHVRQQIVLGIALGITVCVFLVWGISKFRTLSHKIEESRSTDVQKPASPFAVFGKSIKSFFVDNPFSGNESDEFMPIESDFEEEEIYVETTMTGENELFDFQYGSFGVEESFEGMMVNTSSDQDTTEFYGENQ